MNRCSAGLPDLAAANAGRADFHALIHSVLIDTDSLDIGFKNTRGNFHHVHTDTTFFLGKTSPDDPATVKFFLAADFTDIAHYDTSYMLHYLLKTISSILDHTKHARLKVYEYNTPPDFFKILRFFF